MMKHPRRSTLRLPPDPRPRRNAGFSLIEVAIATIVLAVGVLGMLAAQQSIHRESGHAEEIASAMSLAHEIREITLALPRNDPITGDMTFGPESNETSVVHYDDVDDFAGPGANGLTLNPPVNAFRQPVPALAHMYQVVTVDYADPADVAGAASPTPTPIMRVTVRVMKDDPQNGIELARLRWLASDVQ